jgi:peptide deformylase
MELYTYPAEILKRRTILVVDPTSVAEAAGEMFELMRVSDGIGLAAPQVGIGQRFFVLKLPRDRERVLVNPEITWQSRRSVSSEESCLSLPGVSVEVERSARVKIRASDEHGEPFELSARGLLARAIQHELDHLNGVLCIDRIDMKRRHRIARRLEARNAYGTAAGHTS